MSVPPLEKKNCFYCGISLSEINKYNDRCCISCMFERQKNNQDIID